MYLRAEPHQRGRLAAPDSDVKSFECEHDALVLDDFLVGDYRLRPAHYERMMRLVQRVRESAKQGAPATLVISGFTDSSGTEMMNLGLSHSRANEVETFFVRRGTPVHSAAGEGVAKEPGDNRTEVGRRRNRRVEIRVCRT